MFCGAGWAEAEERIAIAYETMQVTCFSREQEDIFLSSLFLTMKIELLIVRSSLV